MAQIEPTDSVFYFSISVPYTQCEALYSPAVPSVVMMAESGVRVQVPTNRLRQFITSDGVKGRFRMIVNQHNKIRAIERLR